MPVQNWTNFPYCILYFIWSLHQQAPPWSQTQHIFLKDGPLYELHLAFWTGHIWRSRTFRFFFANKSMSFFWHAIKNGYELDIYKLGSQLLQPYSLRKTNLHYLRVPLFALLRPVQKPPRFKQKPLLDLSSFAWRGGGSLVQRLSACGWDWAFKATTMGPGISLFPQRYSPFEVAKGSSFGISVVVISPIFLGGTFSLNMGKMNPFWRSDCFKWVGSTTN